MTFVYRGLLLLASLVIAAAVACGQGETDVPQTAVVDAAPELQPQEAAAEAPAAQPDIAPASVNAEPTPETAVPTATPRAVAAGLLPGYSSDLNMYELFSGLETSADEFQRALQRAAANKDTAQVAPIIDVLRFMGFGEPAQLAAFALQQITGEQFGGGAGSWSQWVEWLGNNSAQFRPPSRYQAWKALLYSTLISPRFAVFLGAEKVADGVDLTEIAWGGVLPDGIPDLNNAPTILASEADYLEPDEKVFGVSINGEHRAYPLRIMNPHEMANDFLGGEPISLAY